MFRPHTIAADDNSLAAQPPDFFTRAVAKPAHMPVFAHHTMTRNARGAVVAQDVPDISRRFRHSRLSCNIRVCCNFSARNGPDNVKNSLCVIIVHKDNGGARLLGC